jgi:hypothetical protein
MKESALRFTDHLVAVLCPRTQQLLRLFVERRWNIDDEVNKKVTATATVQVLDALVAESVDGAIRATGLDIERDVLLQCRYRDGRTEDGLAEGNVGLVMQVVTVALESYVALDTQVHKESPVWAAA